MKDPTDEERDFIRGLLFPSPGYVTERTAENVAKGKAICDEWITANVDDAKFEGIPGASFAAMDILWEQLLEDEPLSWSEILESAKRRVN